MKSQLFFLFRVSFLFLLLLGVSALFAREEVRRWGMRKVLIEPPIILDYPRGTSLRELAHRLEQDGAISESTLFLVWARLFAPVRKFQAGTYLLEGEISPQDLSVMLVEGKIYQPIVFEVTIPEGFTVLQTAERLAANGVGSREELVELSIAADFLESLGVEAPSLEGFLYPATYPLTYHPTPKQILSLMVEEFFERLPSDYRQRVASKGLTLLEAITFASLIERETRLDSERTLVSEVIWNRLNKGMALAIDASIIFGIENFDGNLRRRHLVDRLNLYNTRVHSGLPPGPICTPTVESLLAVLSPSNRGNYYYVVDANDFERHRFAKTLAEHNRNVRDYVKARKYQKGN